MIVIFEDRLILVNTCHTNMTRFRQIRSIPESSYVYLTNNLSAFLIKFTRNTNLDHGELFILIYYTRNTNGEW